MMPRRSSGVERKERFVRRWLAAHRIDVATSFYDSVRYLFRDMQDAGLYSQKTNWRDTAVSDILQDARGY